MSLFFKMKEFATSAMGSSITLEISYTRTIAPS